jgi:hypothetical protein
MPYLVDANIQHHLTIVTHNTADFPDDLPVLNPWMV